MFKQTLLVVKRPRQDEILDSVRKKTKLITFCLPRDPFYHRIPLSNACIQSVVNELKGALKNVNLMKYVLPSTIEIANKFGWHMNRHFASEEELIVLMGKLSDYTIDEIGSLSFNSKHYQHLKYLASFMGWQEHKDYTDFPHLAYRLFTYAGGFPFNRLPDTIKKHIMDYLNKPDRRAMTQTSRGIRNILFTASQRQFAALAVSLSMNYGSFSAAICELIAMDNASLLKRIADAGHFTVDPLEPAPLHYHQNGYSQWLFNLKYIINHRASKTLGSVITTKVFSRIVDIGTALGYSVLRILLLMPNENTEIIFEILNMRDYWTKKRVDSDYPMPDLLTIARNHTAPAKIIIALMAKGVCPFHGPIPISDSERLAQDIRFAQEDKNGQRLLYLQSIKQRYDNEKGQCPCQKLFQNKS